ncbi:MAG: polysaccharide lyase family 7 protein [Acidaminococcaceae bacterium]|jgi:hypothetical protein|nr:polysaccharide lyase family 7 protein [Acidaminococcaceae bacterium]
MDLRKLFLLLAALVILFLQPLWERPKLNPELPPGGNFNLTAFKLQLPVGRDGKIQEVPPAALAGRQGFTNKYFYTDQQDGSMTMLVPKTGVTTPNSQHCRTELREMTDGWLPFGVHTLEATVRVAQVQTHTVLGQIYQAGNLHKPLCLLAYYADGQVKLILNQVPAGGQALTTVVAQVQPGAQFKYVLELSDLNLAVNVDGQTTNIKVPLVYGGTQFYFKAGNYDQDSHAGPVSDLPDAEVHFYKLTLKHQS